MKTNILQCLLCLLLPATIIAQTTDPRSKSEKRAERRERINKLMRQEEEGALIFHKQNLFAVKLYSDGYALMFEKGFLKTPTRTTLFSLELAERKNRKEERVGSLLQTSFFSTNSYIYGKINNFYMAKLGVGQSLLIGGKNNRNGVAVSAIGKGGLSVGLVKPYLLSVTDANGRNEYQIAYKDGTAGTDTLFLDPNYIIRSAGPFKGFNQLKVRPGVFAQTGLRFDYGHFNEVVGAVEVGVNVEYYASKIQQMAMLPGKNFFLNVYAAIEFGKRK